MQVHTKKPLTKEKSVVDLTITGPLLNKEKAMELLKPLGFIDTSDSVPWREVFPNITDEKLPGFILKGARTREGITQKKLSSMTGIPQHQISEIENLKRSIGKSRAKILAKALNTGYKNFL